MEYVYATMILHKLNKPINEENLKKVLTAAGAKVDDARVKATVAAVEGVDIEAAIKEAAVAPVAPAEKKEEKEEKKEKKVDKKEEEKAAAGLGALFG